MGRAIVILFCLVLFEIGIIYFLLRSNFKHKKELKDVKEKIKDLEVQNEEYAKIHKETIENQKKYRSGDDNSNFNASLKFLRELAEDE